jgi:hypothetical protein
MNGWLETGFGMLVNFETINKALQNISEWWWENQLVLSFYQSSPTLRTNTIPGSDK